MENGTNQELNHNQLKMLCRAYICTLQNNLNDTKNCLYDLLCSFGLEDKENDMIDCNKLVDIMMR